MSGKSMIYKGLLNILGVVFCTVPVLLSIILYFPLWISSDSGRFISGFCVLLLSLAALPAYRFVKSRLSDIPAYTLWLIIFFICFFASRIINELTVISFVGFSGNLIGALIFKIKARVFLENE